jgi:hypothetical protein
MFGLNLKNFFQVMHIFDKNLFFQGPSFSPLVTSTTVSMISDREMRQPQVIYFVVSLLS